MKKLLLGFIILFVGCAKPPVSNPSKVEVKCAQSCSKDLAQCSSGFKLFPVIAQQQCNDAYDVCINGCPEREKTQALKENNLSQRLKKLEKLYKSGLIDEKEYSDKRKEILNSL